MRWFSNAVLAIISVFAPIKAALLSVVVLTISDMITGIMAARRRKEPITSAGLGRTVVKFLVYQTATILGFLTETYLTGSLVPICKMITALIGITELKSVLENLDSISGGNFFAKLIQRLGSKNDN